jgi:superfamily II DNA or RNA helicase
MQLYAWQQTAIDKLRLSRSLLVQAPPGAGKSMIGVVISETIDSDVLVITHSTTIAKQWQNDYGIKAMVINSAVKCEKISHTVVILDECHHYESAEWSKIYGKLDCKYIIGFSATPNQSKKRFADHLIVKWSDIEYPPLNLI